MIHIMAHIYPGSNSPKSRSKCEFHLHPRPISSPSRPIAHSHLAFIQVVSHLNPGLYICVPSSSRWRLSSNQVRKNASLFHPDKISNQSKSQDVHLASLQVLCDQHRGPNVLVSPPSMHHQRPNIRAACYLGLYHLHPVLKTACQFHPGITPNQSNLLDLCLISIQVLSHLKTGSKILVSPSSRWHLNSIQIVITISQLHSDPISNPYRSQDVCLTSIQVLSQLASCISAPS